MFKIMERMSYIFPSQNKNEHFKTIILDKLVWLLEIYQYPSYEYLMQCLKQEVEKWGCVLDHSSCKYKALNKLKWHLDDPVYNKLMPGWKTWTYCYGLSIADMPVFQKVYNMYSNETQFKKNKRILEYLSCSKTFYILATAPEFVYKSNFQEIKENSTDNINFFHYNVAKHAKSTTILNHIMQNWETIIPKEISTAVALIDIINHTYVKEQLDQRMTFVENLVIYSSHTVTGFRKNDAIELIQNKINLRLLQIRIRINTFETGFGRSLTK